MESVEEKQENRGVVLAAVAVIGLILSSSYLWSVFSGPLRQANGWSPSQVSMVYSTNLLASCIANFFAEKVQRTFSIRKVVLVCGLLYGGAWALTSFAREMWQLYLFYVVLMGSCSGMIYNTAVSVASHWYPDRKGFADGICIASMGIAPLVLAPVANWIVERFDVFVAFRGFGIAFMIVFLLLSTVIRVPAPGWKPSGWMETAGEKNVHGRDRTAGEMMRTPAFWMVWAMVATGISAGTMMSGHISNIGQQMLGMTAARGALLLSLFALVNTVSRLVLAPLSDRVGRFPILSTAIALTAADMLFVIGRTHSFVTFGLAMSVAAVGYGAVMAILPAVVSDLFGETHFSANYSRAYSGYTAAAFIGPTVGAMFVEHTGSYEGAFSVLGGLAIAGLILSLLASRASRRL